MSTNLIRQTIDIQNQINSINKEFTYEQLNSLLNYNTEIKNYLLENVQDKNILWKIEGIPIFTVKDFKIRFDFIGLFVNIFSGNFDSFNDKIYDYGKALEALHDIKNKYASLKILLENSTERIS